MKNIFEKPIIFNGLGGKAVLIYGDYIIGNVLKESTDAIIDKIRK
ncbi:hypothetical protein [Flavobacterium ginsenosidimutans]